MSIRLVKREPQTQVNLRPSRLMTWLALVAFLLQGLIVQTHVHQIALQASAPVAQQDHQPAPKAPVDCPACQLYAAAAAVLLPYVATVPLPLSWVESRFLAHMATNNPPAARQGWQSRAPPRA